MKLSAFTFVRNARRFGYPMAESIASVMDIVDEYVIAVGDSSDDTLEQVRTLQATMPKIKIVETIWDTDKYPRASVYAQQTDLAKMHCTGDWLLYLQTDEVIHEKYLPEIKSACEKYVADQRVEGFIFRFEHFWGDFSHVNRSHNFYPYEMRIIRNLPQIHSWRDAQSFRIFPQGDEFLPDYFVKEGTRKLRAVQLDAEVYHYGWARHPATMNSKNNMARRLYNPETGQMETAEYYDYGNMDKFPVMPFRGTHPAVMKDFIASNQWPQYLRHEGPRCQVKPKHLLLSYIEQHILGSHARIFGFNNFQRIK